MPTLLGKASLARRGFSRSWMMLLSMKSPHWPSVIQTKGASMKLHCVNSAKCPASGRCKKAAEPYQSDFAVWVRGQAEEGPQCRYFEPWPLRYPLASGLVT